MYTQIKIAKQGRVEEIREEKRKRGTERGCEKRRGVSVILLNNSSIVE